MTEIVSLNSRRGKLIVVVAFAWETVALSVISFTILIELFDGDDEFPVTIPEKVTPLKECGLTSDKSTAKFFNVLWKDPSFVIFSISRRLFNELTILRCKNKK